MQRMAGYAILYVLGSCGCPFFCPFFQSEPFSGQQRTGAQGVLGHRSYDLYWALYRKVTIWARVQAASGLKVVSVVPFVMPCSVAHRTALS